MGKRLESMSAREQRVERPRRRLDGVARRSAQHDRHAAAGLDDHQARDGAPDGQSPPGCRSLRIPSPARITGTGSREAFSPALDAYQYLGFEDRFRGSRDAIRERLESYVPLFEGKGPCSTSAAAAENSSTSSPRITSPRGVSISITRWRKRAAPAASTSPKLMPSAISRRSRTRSLGAIFSAQVVEHLEPAYLLRFLELAFHRLRPGGRLVLETLNPACWVAFFDSYIRDITHVWPLHPDTLKYLVVASGFTGARVEFRSPVPPEDKLQAFAAPTGAAALADLAEAFNANVEKLNARMFTYLDYAVIGDKAS